mmetsp:Transcript_9491/g.41019  ORF Transcript_9491/g.41019 Transcript_9491/m.41019 type:complete len:99 (-) Transcript_9491:1171-1467(-)
MDHLVERRRRVIITSSFCEQRNLGRIDESRNRRWQDRLDKSAAPNLFPFSKQSVFSRLLLLSFEQSSVHLGLERTSNRCFRFVPNPRLNAECTAGQWQ